MTEKVTLSKKEFLQMKLQTASLVIENSQLKFNEAKRIIEETQKEISDLEALEKEVPIEPEVEATLEKLGKTSGKA